MTGRSAVSAACRDFCANGHFGQRIYLSPDASLGPVRLESRTGTDPREALPRGAIGVNLWVTGQAPLEMVGLDSTILPINGPSSGPSKKPVVIHTWVFAGERDDLNPNNEFIELKIDPTVFTGASYDLTGHCVRNDAGDRYNFPAGTALTPTTAIRLYTGSGTNTATKLNWGEASGIYNNLGDGAELYFPNASYYLIGNAACRYVRGQAGGGPRTVAWNAAQVTVRASAGHSPTLARRRRRLHREHHAEPVATETERDIERAVPVGDDVLPHRPHLSDRCATVEEP